MDSKKRRLLLLIGLVCLVVTRVVIAELEVPDWLSLNNTFVKLLDNRSVNLTVGDMHANYFSGDGGGLTNVTADVPADLTIDSLNVTGNATVYGNLTVNGNIMATNFTTVNYQTFNITQDLNVINGNISTNKLLITYVGNFPIIRTLGEGLIIDYANTALQFYDGATEKGRIQNYGETGIQLRSYGDLAFYGASGDGYNGDIILSPAGKTTTAKQITSTLATGTSPFTVDSTTKVTNLNCDQTDGYSLNQDVTTSGSPSFTSSIKVINITGQDAQVEILENSTTGFKWWYDASAGYFIGSRQDAGTYYTSVRSDYNANSWEVMNGGILALWSDGNDKYGRVYHDDTNLVIDTNNGGVSIPEAVTVTTLDTGQGANELYDMNQNVLTSSEVDFADVGTQSITGANIRMNGGTGVMGGWNDDTEDTGYAFWEMTAGDTRQGFLIWDDNYCRTDTEDVCLTSDTGFDLTLRGSSQLWLTGGGVYSTTIYADTVGATNRDVYVDDTGNLGYVSSSIRYKENLRSLDKESEKIYLLNPVLFDYKDKTQGVNKYGLIAEEVEGVLPSIVSYESAKYDIVGTTDTDTIQVLTNPATVGLPETVSYDSLTPLLLNEAIKTNDRVTNLENNETKMDNRLTAMSERLDAMEALLTAICKAHPEIEECKV